MFVIVEGSDLSGKTTFLEKLSKRMNCGVIIKNALKPRVSAVDLSTDYYAEMTRLKIHYNSIFKAGNYFDDDQHIFLDRFFPSQVVYSVLRGKDDFSDDWYEEFEMTMRGKTVYIWIFEDEETLRQRYDDRGDEHVNFEQILIVHRRYQQFFERCKLPKLALKSSDPEYITRAVQFINSYQ
jgi:thymidylate kinase